MPKKIRNVTRRGKRGDPHTIEGPGAYDGDSARGNVVNCLVDVRVRVERRQPVCVRPHEPEWPAQHNQHTNYIAAAAERTHSPLRMNWPFSTVTKPLSHRFVFVVFVGTRPDALAAAAATASERRVERRIAQSAAVRACETFFCWKRIKRLSGGGKARTGMDAHYKGEVSTRAVHKAVLEYEAHSLSARNPDGRSV